jgi:hypothetical protein
MAMQRGWTFNRFQAGDPVAPETYWIGRKEAMFRMRKLLGVTLTALAGAAGLLVAAGSVGALGHGDAGPADVVADSPWDAPAP